MNTSITRKDLKPIKKDLVKENKKMREALLGIAELARKWADLTEHSGWKADLNGLAWRAEDAASESE